MDAKFSRRFFLKGVGLTLLLNGCQVNDWPFTDSSGPTSVPPTPTAVPNADQVAQAYLQAWQAGDYGRMYDLLSPDSRILLRDQQRFADFYRLALREARVTTIETQLLSLLYQGQTALVGFRTTWQTTLFGALQFESQMRLKYLVDRWGVEWQPTLVLPQLGQELKLAFLSEQPTRGNIYDRKNHALATQGQMITVGLVPQQMENQDMAVRHLAAITGAKPEKIAEELAEAQPNWFVPIAEIDFEISLKYDTLLNTIPGVERRVHDSRAYTGQEVAAHIVGYMGTIPPEQRETYQQRGYNGTELVGLMGLERWGEPHLAGQRGGRLVTLSPAGKVMSEIATISAEAGSSLYLTLDTKFQSTVEQLLGDRLGAVVVMNPTDGTIYALASYPRFKPAVLSAGFDVEAWVNLYSTDSRPLINRTTQGLYPPASIFKIVTMAAALESLGARPEDTFICKGHWGGLGPDFPKKCWLERGHGLINLFDGLTQSCDVVFYELGLALHRQDPQLLPTWARHFGLGQPTGLTSLAESGGVVPDNAWKEATLDQPFFDGDAVNSAIGQGYMLSTPLQIARLTAAVANGGLLVQPQLVDRLSQPDGDSQFFETATPTTIPLSVDNLALIQQSMAEVVSGARGTARVAFSNFTETVAGKTGTAETGQENPHAWFTGYTPADEARVVITVILEHAGEGSTEAAPLFRQVAEAFLAWEAELRQDSPQ